MTYYCIWLIFNEWRCPENQIQTSWRYFKSLKDRDSAWTSSFHIIINQNITSINNRGIIDSMNQKMKSETTTFWINMVDTYKYIKNKFIFNIQVSYYCIYSIFNEWRYCMFQIKNSWKYFKSLRYRDSA